MIIDQRAIPLGSGYLLHEVIGRGATGEVWRASTRAGEPVAAKLLLPDFASDTAVIGQFLHERTVLSSIRDRHVVAMRELVLEGSTLAIVMDLVDGGDLRRWLGGSPTVAPRLAVDITRQVLLGLDAVHRAGVVHCDLKPENVLVTTTETGVLVRVSDAGIARITFGEQASGDAAAGGVVGTPEYVAPEVVAGAVPTAAADLYAAGVVLYELLAGRTPFAADHPAAVLHGHLAMAPARPRDVPDALWHVLRTLLDKDPSRRPASAAEAAGLLAVVAPTVDCMLPAPPTTDPPLPIAEDDLGTRDGVVPASAPADPASTDPTPADRVPQPRRRLVRVGAAAAVLALVIAVLVRTDRLPGVGPTSAPPPPARVLLGASTPSLTAAGAVTTRRLSATTGTDVVDVTVAASIGAASVDVVERVPSGVATSADAVTADGAEVAVEGGAVVVRGRSPLRYRIRLDRPVSSVRALDDVARRYDTDLPPDAKRLATIESVESPLVVAPSGDAVDLALRGRLSDGSPAPVDLLVRPVVRVVDGPLTVDDDGRVGATAPGAGAVEVVAGAARVRVPVLATRTANGAPCRTDRGLLRWRLDGQPAAVGLDVALDELPADRPVEVRVAVRNVGDAVWCGGGDHGVVLRASGDTSVGRDWIGGDVVARLAEDRVVPGGVGTFRFDVAAASAEPVTLELRVAVADGQVVEPEESGPPLELVIGAA